MDMEINSTDLADALNAVQATGNDEALITLKDDRWIIKSSDESTILMAAVLTPESAMVSYDKGDYDRVGFHINKVTNFISGSSRTIRLWMENRALYMSDGSYKARVATIDPASVQGHIPNAPQIDYEATVNGDPSFIFDFISKQKEIVNTDSYKIGIRDSGIILYADGDNGELAYDAEWDEFESSNIDWEVNNSVDEGPDGRHIPAEDYAADTIMATAPTEDIKTPSDNCTMHFANQMPMKFLFEKDEGDGMKISFIQAPRIENNGNPVVPDSVVEESF